MIFKYCPVCGRELTTRISFDEGGVPYCEHDDMMFFDTPKPCIIVAVIKNDEILLLKQSYIYENSKVLVSGYVAQGETVEETVKREVLEETGIVVDNIRYIGSDCLKAKELLMITYMANYVSGEIIESPEVEHASWIKLDVALAEMHEDKIGMRIVEKVLKILKTEGKA